MRPIYILTLALIAMTCSKGGSGAGGSTSGAADNDAPTPGNTGTITTSVLARTALQFQWTPATDNVTQQSSLQYLAYRSLLNNIDTVQNIEANGTAIGSFATDITSIYVSGLTPATTYYFNIIVKDAAGNKAVYAQTSALTRAANAAPTVVSSTPLDNATNTAVCSGDPCSAKIILVFNETMNTALTQALTTEVLSGGFVSAPNAGSTFAWSTTNTSNDTLTINLSWYRFPENSQVRYTLAASGLQDTAGNSIGTQVQRSFTTTAVTPAFSVSDTGQTSCYSDSASTTCTGNSGSYPNQDGDFTTPNSRNFTGPTAHNTYTTDYTTTDNVAGLVWKSCNEGLSGALCATGVATQVMWFDAINQCASLNTANSGAGYAGKTTWRLPTYLELLSVTNLADLPGIDATYFPGTGPNRYWTASTNVASNSTAWAVDFDTGSSVTLSQYDFYYVRCVSPGS